MSRVGAVAGEVASILSVLMKRTSWVASPLRGRGLRGVALADAGLGGVEGGASERTLSLLWVRAGLNRGLAFRIHPGSARMSTMGTVPNGLHDDPMRLNTPVIIRLDDYDLLLITRASHDRSPLYLRPGYARATIYGGRLWHTRASGRHHGCCQAAPRQSPVRVPSASTLRFHGVLGPRAAWRSAVIPRRHDAVDEGPAAGRSEGTGPRAEPSPGSLGLPSGSSMWAALLRRVFALDVFQFPRCGGRRRIVGVHTGGERLRVLLERLGLVIASPSAEPSRSPPRRGA
jgi:hypothetical protein